MRFMISKLQLTSLLAVFAVVALLATAAQATVHPLTGNARFQIGDGLPVPITFAGAPKGPILVPASKLVFQAPGLDPRKMVVEKRSFDKDKSPFNLPVWGANHAVYQVNTSIGIEVPLIDEVLSAGRRSGAATVSYCPGSGPVAPGSNPGCASGLAAVGNLKGIMIYTATGNQFGGPMGGRVFGTANVAINLLGAVPPFTGAIMHMALASPVSTGTGGIGDHFGGFVTSNGKITQPGVFTITATTMGGILTATPTSLGAAGLTNMASGGGGPWTTGMIYITQPLAGGTAEKFSLTGTDNRVSGVGTISLVAGGLSNRQVSGPNANRGWLNMTIGAPLDPLPSMSGPGIAALVGLMSLAGGYAMRQRNRK